MRREKRERLHRHKYCTWRKSVSTCSECLSKTWQRSAVGNRRFHARLLTRCAGEEAGEPNRGSQPQTNLCLGAYRREPFLLNNGLVSTIPFRPERPSAQQSAVHLHRSRFSFRPWRRFINFLTTSFNVATSRSSPRNALLNHRSPWRPLPPLGLEFHSGIDAFASTSNLRPLWLARITRSSHNRSTLISPMHPLLQPQAYRRAPR